MLLILTLDPLGRPFQMFSSIFRREWDESLIIGHSRQISFTRGRFLRP